MPTRADLAAAALALALHVALGWGLLRSPPGARVPSVVEVEFRTPATAAAPPPALRRAEAPRSDPARHRPRSVASAQPVQPATPSPAPPPAPPPVFGFSMESTVGESSMSVPVGESTGVDPRRSTEPAPPSGGGGLDGGAPGALAIRTLPEIDTSACGRTISYPPEAIALGLEGSVKLRVAIDERGRVADVKVLSGLGHGLDREAVDALQHRCRFAPAIANDGRPVAFVIDPYVFHFEIPR